MVGNKKFEMKDRRSFIEFKLFELIILSMSISSLPDEGIKPETRISLFSFKNTTSNSSSSSSKLVYKDCFR